MPKQNVWAFFTAIFDNYFLITYLGFHLPKWHWQLHLLVVLASNRLLHLEYVEMNLGQRKLFLLNYPKAKVLFGIHQDYY
jgi:hypothetical protein